MILNLNGHREFGGGALTYRDLRAIGTVQWPSGDPRPIRVRHPADVAGTGCDRVLALAWVRTGEESGYSLERLDIPLDTSGPSFTIYGSVGELFVWDILELRIASDVLNVGDISIDRDGDGGATPADSRIVIEAGAATAYNAAFYVPPGWSARVGEVYVEQPSGGWRAQIGCDTAAIDAPVMLGPSPLQPEGSGTFVEGDRFRLEAAARNTTVHARARVEFMRSADGPPGRRALASI